MNIFNIFKKQPIVHRVTAHDLLQTVGQDLYDEVRTLEILQDSGSPAKRKQRRQLCINRIRTLLGTVGIFDGYQLTKV